MGRTKAARHPQIVTTKVTMVPARALAKVLVPLLRLQPFAVHAAKVPVKLVVLV